MHVFSRLKLRNKALLAPAFLLVAGAGLTVSAVERHGVEMTRERKETVATMVAAAKAVTAHFADEEASGRLTRKAAMLAARDVISRMRLGSGQDVVLGPGAASGVPPGGQVVDWPNQAALPEPVGFVRPNLKVMHHAGTANPPIMAGRAEEAAQVPAQDSTAAPGQWDLAIDAGSYIEDARADAWPFAERLGALTLAAVIVAGLLGWAAIADFDDALRRVVASMRRPAEGGMRMRVCDRARPDEVGAVAKAVDALQAGLAAAAKLRDESAAAQNEVVSCFADAFSRLAEGDLTCAIQGQVAAEFEPLRKSYNVAVDALRAEVSSMIDGARTVGRDAIEVSRAAERLAHCSGQQRAEWLDRMNAALDDTTAVARKVTEGSVSAQAVAKAAETEATWGEQIVRETVAAMNSVGKTSAQVGAIIGVMDKVASQTNLLALNAGIEAARAGDFGRGFGVVATEVGALARRSAAAAKEIRGLISTSMSHMGQRIALIQQSGEAFGRIRAQVAASVEMVSEIAAAAREQAAALAEVNNAVNQISQAALPALTVAGELTAEARSVADDAARLEALTGRFKLGAAA